MVDRESSGMMKRLVTQWDHFRLQLERLRPAAQVRPRDAQRVFQIVTSPNSGAASFTLCPVVFNVPERADDFSLDLFVVVEGRLSFRRKDFNERKVLATHDFSTKVAYFRRTATALHHVYGAHYDFSLNELGHPVFHGQMRSYPELADAIKQQFYFEREVIDSVGGLLRTVRVPTAQMDVFSFFIQLCADHLVYAKSGSDEKAAFNSLLQKNDFCQGAAYQVPRLQLQEAYSCYRSRHWYPDIA
jgi:hypothetical protein